VLYGLDKVDVGCGNVGASIQAGEAVVILCKAAPKSPFNFCLKNLQKNKTCGMMMIRRISMRTTIKVVFQVWKSLLGEVSGNPKVHVGTYKDDIICCS
jgi:hypothetical protein